MEWKYPRCLKKGMTIGCIAPASSSDESLDAIQQICEEYGYQIIFGESCYRTGLYGGSPEEQAQEFEWMMTAAPCDAVLALRGGYGTMRYIDRLDYTAIREYGKPFIGYSDCTALHMAINRYSRLVTYHCPMGVELTRARNEDRHQLFET